MKRLIAAFISLMLIICLFIILNYNIYKKTELYTMNVYNSVFYNTIEKALQ